METERLSCACQVPADNNFLCHADGEKRCPIDQKDSPIVDIATPGLSDLWNVD